MARRKPAPCCVVCNRTLEETGGKRLVSTPSHTISIGSADTPIGAYKHPSRTLRLEDNYRDVVVAIHGERICTDEIVERVRVACQAGQRPWFCQGCAQRNICKVCGAPLRRVPGADHMEDDGNVVHSAFFAGFGDYRICPNVDCGAEQWPSGRSDNRR